MGESIIMLSPELRKEFKRDLAVVRRGVRNALGFLDAEDELEKAKAQMKETRTLAIDVGRALRRIHASRSYREEFADWTQMCRGVGLQRHTAYRLMKHAELIDGLPTEQVEKIPDGLSYRQREILCKIGPEKAKEVVKQLAESPAPKVADKFAELKQSWPRAASAWRLMTKRRNNRRTRTSARTGCESCRWH